MNESYEELDAELVSALKNQRSLNREYTQRFISITPLGNGPVLTFALSEIKEVADRYRAAKERYHEASRKMQSFRHNHHS